MLPTPAQTAMRFELGVLRFAQNSLSNCRIAAIAHLLYGGSPVKFHSSSSPPKKAGLTHEGLRRGQTPRRGRTSRRGLPSYWGQPSAPRAGHALRTDPGPGTATRTEGRPSTENNTLRRGLALTPRADPCTESWFRAGDSPHTRRADPYPENAPHIEGSPYAEGRPRTGESHSHRGQTPCRGQSLRRGQPPCNSNLI
jgi:hypothetical protein